MTRLCCPKLLLTAFGLFCCALLGAQLVLPSSVFSEPLAQDEVLHLQAGEVFQATLTNLDHHEYLVYAPVGETLTVWIGTDSQGGCWWYAGMYLNGQFLDSTFVGSEPNTWSEPISHRMTGAPLEVDIAEDTTCLNVTYPVYTYVHMQVSGTPQPDTPTPAPEINFWADRYQIQQGECTIVRWQVYYVQAVYFQGEGVGGTGERQACPTQTTTYELRVVTASGEERRYVTIEVDAPTPTATPPPTPTQPPPTPTQLPPTPTPPPTSTRQATSTPTRRPTSTATHRATSTPTRRPTSTATRRATSTPTRRPTSTATRRATSTPTRRPTSTPTPTRTPTATPSPTPPSTRTSTRKLLVVTHSNALNGNVGLDDPILGTAWGNVENWLDNRYGPDGYDVLDLASYWPTRLANALETDLKIEAQWSRERYWAIFIIGSNYVVHYASAPNQADDEPVWTDDLYSDLNGDWVPDVLLARLPDGGSMALLANQINRHQGESDGRALLLAQDQHFYAETLATAFSGARVFYAEETVLDGSGVDAIYNYFALNNCSGVRNDSWCYASDGLPFHAFGTEDASSRGVVVTEAGYGAAYCSWQPCNGNIDSSIPLRFLHSGARAFIGTTVSNYWLPRIEMHSSGAILFDYRGIGQGIPRFAADMINDWSASGSPLVAFHRAKVKMLGSARPTNPSADMIAKMGHGLVYYGVPPALADCPACVPQQVKPSIPNRYQSSAITIDVERPLEVLETGERLTAGCGFLDCDCAMQDSDLDGLPDTLEWRLAYEFEPFLEFDEAERANPRDPYSLDIYHQVSPDRHKDYGDTILLTYVLAYDKDYGSVNWGVVSGLGADSVFEAHSGDTEMMRVRLDYAFDYPYLRVWMHDFEIKRHFDAPESFPPVNGGGPMLYISRDKHAAYISEDECHAYTFAGIPFEECGGGPRGWASELVDYLHTNHNVGEVEDPDFKTQHWRQYTYTFNDTYLWETNGDVRFCGNTPDCARYWSPVEMAIHWKDELPVFGQVYGICKKIWLCKPFEWIDETREGILGRFFDKGAGPFGPKWNQEPIFMDLRRQDLTSCVEF